MCGRFALNQPSNDIAIIMDAAADNDLPQTPNFNTCPTDKIRVITGGGARRRLTGMRWGFVPHWYKTPNDGPLLINARSETIAQKPAFQMACRQRRCLIPISGFYECQKGADGQRLPWYITAPDMLVLAGVWQEWGQGEDQVNTCAIVTCAANDALGHIHHRMPVILGANDWATWLHETDQKAAPLMCPTANDALLSYRVSASVNSNRASGAGLMAPINSS